MMIQNYYLSITNKYEGIRAQYNQDLDVEYRNSQRNLNGGYDDYQQ